MKQIITLILIFSFSFCQAQNDAVERANKLIKKRKYESAIKILDKADPNNEKPEIVIAKTDLFLNYFVTSIMHELFAVKDLEPDEELMEVRGSNGNFAMFAFKADSLLKGLIKKYPENYNLHKTLGYYYHEVHLKYRDSWLEPDSVVIDKFHNYYKTAYKNDVYDYWSLYGLGYAEVKNKNYKKAIPYFEKSIELKGDYPTSHYNLAYSYLYNNEREKAIESAKKAFDLYEYPQYKADAARIIGAIYRELDKNNKALEFYIKSDNIQPNSYYTLRPLLETEMIVGTDTYKKRTHQFFLLDPDNPTIYQDLMRIYWNNDKQMELIDFLKAQFDDFRDNDKVFGNLHFFIAKIQYDSGNNEKAKSNFEKSKEIFKNVYDSNHRVFKIIDSYTKEM
jgi:tetratricopeptide (TPR) repeat protein